MSLRSLHMLTEERMAHSHSSFSASPNPNPNPNYNPILINLILTLLLYIRSHTSRNHLKKVIHTPPPPPTTHTEREGETNTTKHIDGMRMYYVLRIGCSIKGQCYLRSKPRCKSHGIFARVMPPLGQFNIIT